MKKGIVQSVEEGIIPLNGVCLYKKGLDIL